MKQKQIDAILNDKTFEFGKNLYYEGGQVVVWRGYNPCIVRVKRRCFGGYYNTNVESHDSLSCSNLRPATQGEKDLLGNWEILLLKSEPEKVDLERDDLPFLFAVRGENVSKAVEIATVIDNCSFSAFGCLWSFDRARKEGVEWSPLDHEDWNPFFKEV